MHTRCRDVVFKVFVRGQAKGLGLLIHRPSDPGFVPTACVSMRC